jgi:hypothetical protein
MIQTVGTANPLMTFGYRTLGSLSPSPPVIAVIEHEQHFVADGGESLGDGRPLDAP